MPQKRAGSSAVEHRSYKARVTRKPQQSRAVGSPLGPCDKGCGNGGAG